MGISVEIHRVALLFHSFQIELDFRNVGFCGGRKTGVPGETPNNKLNSHMTLGPRLIDLGYDSES